MVKLSELADSSVKAVGAPADATRSGPVSGIPGGEGGLDETDNTPD